MRLLLPLAFLLLAHVGLTQKRIDKTFDTEGLKGVFVDTDQVFQVRVRTTNTDQISLKSSIEGETFESVLINTHKADGFLVIKTARSIGYKAIDDKLAAHKVLSIVLEIVVPEGFDFWMDSALGALEVTGNFGHINVNLASGGCSLSDFRGSGKINTELGDIILNNVHCAISAQTRNGRIKGQQHNAHDALLQVRSIDGDIAISQSE